MLKINRTKRAGFTLVELLMVIIIVGILATLAIAGLNGLSRRAAEAAGAQGLGAYATAAQALQQESPGNLLPTTIAQFAGLVDLPAEHQFTYDVAGGGAANLVITATGRPGTRVAGVEIDLTLRPDGSREPLVTRRP